jgi:hypothetical protein
MNLRVKPPYIITYINILLTNTAEKSYVRYQHFLCVVPIVCGNMEIHESHVTNSLHVLQLRNDIVTCMVVRVTKITGSSSDDWIY